MEPRIIESFNRQLFMHTLGAKLVLIQKGKVEIECTFEERLTQQNGYFHAGVMTSLVDSACGYAAYTMMPDQSDVLTVEFKINFLKPGKTDKILATGNVLQAGKQLIVCEGVVTDVKREILFARMTSTLITILPR